MSSAGYLNDMLGDPEPDLATGPPEVASFYAKRNVLLTGGAGFLGRLLAEKILRSCSDINSLFLLLRAKKGKSPKERFAELFQDVLFDRLKKEKPKFAEKVVLIEGDIMQADLGLSPENRELLRSTHIVIHSAATVRFDEPLRSAFNINIRGTKELLRLATEMRNLEAFVHVSTAYSNCVSNEIEEKFYSPPLDCEKLASLVDILDDASLNHLTPVLLGKWPNTYAFTKAVAEDTVRRNCQGLPVCIVRPSIIVATYEEPVPGWVSNIYGPTGLVVGAAIGLLRTLHCDENLVADMVPADYVVNNIIVAAWDTARAHNQSKEVNSADSSMVPKVEEPRIYNAVSSPQNPFTWRDLMKYTEEHAMQIPSTMCLWYYCLRLNKHRWVHNLSVMFLHLLPAVIVDGLACLTGRKPMLWKTYMKIHKASTVIEYFALGEWRFHNNNVLQLWKGLSAADRSEFNFDMGSFDWEKWSYNHTRGLRTYILKDPLDTVPAGAAKYAKLKMAHYTLVTILCGIFIWLLWVVVRFISGLW